jgi:hypothetical protein
MSGKYNLREVAEFDFTLGSRGAGNDRLVETALSLHQPVLVCGKQNRGNEG